MGLDWNIRYRWPVRLCPLSTLVWGLTYSSVPFFSIVRIWSLAGGLLRLKCWSIVELSSGIVTASIATIRLLFSRAVPSLRSGLAISELSDISRHTTGHRQPSSGSQREFFAEDDLELPRRMDSNNTCPRSEAGCTVRESTSVVSLEQRPHKHLGTATASLHFGLPENLRTGIMTQITTGPSRGRSMSAGGAEFLGTFGIRVKRDWVITESTDT